MDLVATQVASMSEPIAGAVGPDGALYLAERAGTVHQLTEEGLGVPVIDISAQTTTDSERGLLGLAFAPDGNELYLSSTDQDGDTHVLGVTIRDEEIRADEQREIFTIDQPRSNHNGGAIAVGPDGLLYIGLGDGGGAGDPLDVGQDRSSALGSLLRIDPVADAPYRVPDSNPFAGQPDAAPEVFAYGLRNPWRFSFDRATDDLWIADVGQDRREEINRVTLDAASGGNFGWNLMEGTTEFSGPAPEGHIAPVYEYATGGSEGCAVVGGYVYRGAAIEPLVGAYLYADYCVGTVRGLHVDGGGRVIDQAELGIDAGGVLSFAEDGDGEVYVLTVDGGVFRIDQAP